MLWLRPALSSRRSQARKSRDTSRRVPEGTERTPSSAREPASTSSAGRGSSPSRACCSDASTAPSASRSAGVNPTVDLPTRVRQPSNRPSDADTTAAPSRTARRLPDRKTAVCCTHDHMSGHRRRCPTSNLRSVRTRAPGRADAQRVRRARSRGSTRTRADWLAGRLLVPGSGIAATMQSCGNDLELAAARYGVGIELMRWRHNMTKPRPARRASVKR